MSGMTKKKSRTPATTRFPQVIYVQWDPNEDGDPFLVADASPRSADDGSVVAIYEFTGTKVKRITETLE
jgi:hypothetical protein